MKITKIEWQKKKKDWVNIFADNKFLVSLPADDVARYALAKDQELTDERLQTIIGKSRYGKLLNAALHFFSYRQRTEWEIRQYLNKKLRNEKGEMRNEQKDNEEGLLLIETVVDKLRQLDLIDDQKFAKTYRDEKRRIASPKGDRAIKSELLRKGIDKKIIDEQLGKNEETKEISQLSLARTALQKRIKYKVLSNKGNERLKEKAKLLRYLSGRGFDYDTAYKVIEEVFGRE